MTKKIKLNGEPDVRPVMKALAVVAEAGLLQSFQRRESKGVVRLKATLLPPGNKVEKKVEEFEARLDEYNAAWAIWKKLEASHE